MPDEGCEVSLLKLTAIFLLAVLGAAAQQSGIRVRAVRVLATDPEALAIFYEKAFGMSEIRRPVNSATTKEIVVNSGDTVEAARAAQTAPIVIYTRPKDAPAGAMASLILNVPDLNKAIESPFGRLIAALEPYLDQVVIIGAAWQRMISKIGGKDLASEWRQRSSQPSQGDLELASRCDRLRVRER